MRIGNVDTLALAALNGPGQHFDLHQVINGRRWRLTGYKTVRGWAGFAECKFCHFGPEVATPEECVSSIFGLTSGLASDPGN